MAIVNVRINNQGIQRLQRDEIAPWLQKDILSVAEREAKGNVNVDTGNLRSTIGTAIEIINGVPVGFLFAGTNYAIPQEFEPGETIPGRGSRRRRGGKPFLRPAAMAALAPYNQ